MLRAPIWAAGFESLLPYWFELEGTAFLSDKGDVLRKADWDLRPAARPTAGAAAARRTEPVGPGHPAPEDSPGPRQAREFGLRLRYEIKREFAPYVGVSYERRARPDGRLCARRR